MQSGHLTYYPDRSIFYSGNLINLSLENGEDYAKMKTSIIISLVDGILFPNTDKFHTIFVPSETTEHFSLSDKVVWHFIELGKVDISRPVSQMNPLEQYAAYLKYASDETKEDLLIQLLNTNQEVIEMSEHIFKELTEDDIARERLFSHEMYIHDQETRMYEAKRETKIEIAANLLNKMSIAEIAAITGLTQEEIEKI